MGPRIRLIGLAGAAIVLGGCGSGEDGSATRPQPGGPKQVVSEFLDAVRRGDDAAATALLSPLAREKLLEGNRPLTPPASDTARFAVGKVEKISADEARVECAWSDLDPYGERQTDEAQWRLRREAEGWRVVGVVYRVFEDTPPLELNFEDPEDMLRKQQWVDTERRRRALVGHLPGPDAENSENSVRR